MTGSRGCLSKLVPAVAIALLPVAASIQTAEAQAPAGFAVHESPRPLPNIQFENGQGEAMSLADFRGKVVLLNIWATWCAPCRREMPTLDRLQATLGGPDFQVVALSIDRQGVPAVQEFYEEATEVLPTLVNRQAFEFQQYGPAAATAVLMLILLLVCTVAYMRALRVGTDR